MRLPSLLKCTALTGSLWAGRVFRHLPVRTSQIRTLSSKEPLTRRFDWKKRRRLSKKTRENLELINYFYSRNSGHNKSILQQKDKITCGLKLRQKWYFVTNIVLTYCEKKKILVIEKNFWNSRLKAENLKFFLDH